MGVQLIGPHFGEAKLLNAAHRFQQETDWHLKAPCRLRSGVCAMSEGINMEWETVIGLEIHAQLATKTKIFSGSPTAYGAEPNTQADLVDLGYPGVLPVLNAEAVRMAVQFGLAVDAAIAPKSVFARKNYFYPRSSQGLPDQPVRAADCREGSPRRDAGRRRHQARGHHARHLEEDAGKSMHEGQVGLSAIDLNRAGTPLIEIVSEPDMRSAKEAVAYMKKVHTLVRYLGICDGNMQEGSFRCDANVSIRRKGSEKLGTRAELKNLNSFRFVEKAINHEVQRQIDILEGGGKVVQETRLYDSDKDETRSMRSKEEANDYRYFPDPDLLPVVIEQAYIESQRAKLPELPDQKAARFATQYGLSAYDAQVLTASREMAAFYEAVAAAVPGGHQARCQLGDGRLLRLPEQGWPRCERQPPVGRAAGWAAAAYRRQHHLGQARQGSVRGDVGRCSRCRYRHRSARAQADHRQWRHRKSDRRDHGANPKQLADFRSGKDKLFGFFVGQAMKATDGKANPALLNDLLKKKLAP